MHQQFLYYLKQKGCREYTVKQYEQRLRMIFNELPELTQENITEYLYKKSESGCTASTINNYLKVIRAYGNACDYKWVNDIKYWAEEEPNREPLTDGEIETLLSLPSPKGYNKQKWARWTLFLELLAFAGMRPNEVASIHSENVADNIITLPRTKTVPRKVPVPANVKLPEFSGYLFPAQNKSEREYVWRSAWQKHFQKRKDLANISRKGISIYSFRHSFITTLVEEGVNTLAIGHAVGQRDPKSTQKYVHLGVKAITNTQNRHRLVRKTLTPQQQFQQVVDDLRKQGILDSNQFYYELTNNSIKIEIRANSRENSHVDKGVKDSD